MENHKKKTISPELHFSAEEAALAANAAWLLTKHSIIQKVYRLFGALSEEYRGALAGYPGLLPEEVVTISPKIYKGEQYRLLPYVMMDFPRFFDRSDALAIRSLFWWGNHFSVHLLLGGKYKMQFAPAVAAGLAELSRQSWYLQVTDAPWEHHFEAGNYQPLHKNSALNLPGKENYLKLATLLPITGVEKAPTFFSESFKTLLGILNFGQ